MATHGINCDCGKKFDTIDQLNEHLTVKETLEEITRIGGLKYRKVTAKFERDPAQKDLKELCEGHGIDFTPENATEIAQQEIITLVERHDEFGLPAAGGETLWMRLSRFWSSLATRVSPR